MNLKDCLLLIAVCVPAVPPEWGEASLGGKAVKCNYAIDKTAAPMFQCVKSISEQHIRSLGTGADAESHAGAFWKSHRYVTKCVVTAVLACPPWPPGSTMETWSRRRGKFLSGPRDLCIEIVWMSRLHSTTHFLHFLTKATLFTRVVHV